MISINGKNSSSDINEVLEKDFEMFECIMVGSFPPFLQEILEFETNPNYSAMYSFATEDISTYIKQLGTLNSYLSVCASSDQILNGILYGATKIDTFDKNYFAKHSIFFKLAALKALTNEELIKLCTEYDLKLHEKALREAEPYIQLFWEKIFSHYSFDALSLAFGYTRVSLEQIREINPYLEPENYEKLKSLVDKVDINFIESDLYGLPEHIKDKKYDAINLSNIYEYLNFNDNVTLEKAFEFRDFVMNSLYPHLNENGSMLVSYLYSWSDEVKKDFDENRDVFGGEICDLDQFERAILRDVSQCLTTQNLAYSYLIDTFEDIDTIKLPTKHVEYGFSKDMSHDMAFMLKKTK